MSNNNLYLTAIAAFCFALSGFIYARGGSTMPGRRMRLDKTARFLGIAGIVLMVWVAVHAFSGAMEFEPSIH